MKLYSTGVIAVVCDALICDWNGTITKYPDEKPLMEQIAIDIFKTSIPFHLLRVVRLITARRKLNALYNGKRCDDGFDYIIEMFKIYNERIILGLPVSIINNSVDRYATRQQTLADLDHRILAVVKTCHQTGKTTGIFSAGYKDGIQKVLGAAGLEDHFDFCVGDSLKTRDGKAIEFELKLYKRKPTLLANLLKERNLDPRTVAYIGDSEDDEGCFDIVGYPVMSFFASEELKQKCAWKYNAFVPKDEQDLMNHLGFD